VIVLAPVRIDLDTKGTSQRCRSVLSLGHRPRRDAPFSYVAAFYHTTEPTAGTYSDRRRASDWANAAVVALVLSAEKGALEWHLNELA
jgi:hypothetical protein